MKENIRVLFKPVGQPWEVRTIRNSWEDLHDLVEGFIEYVKISDHLALVVNDCGVINDMPLNFKCADTFIFGPAVMVGIDGPETTSCRVSAASLNFHMLSVFDTRVPLIFESAQRLYGKYKGDIKAAFDLSSECSEDNADLDVDPDDLPGAEEVI